MNRHGAPNTVGAISIRNPWTGHSESVSSSGSSQTWAQGSSSVGPPCYQQLQEGTSLGFTTSREDCYGGRRSRQHPLESGTFPLPVESSGKYLLSRGERGVPTAVVPPQVYPSRPHPGVHAAGYHGYLPGPASSSNSLGPQGHLYHLPQGTLDGGTLRGGSRPVSTRCATPAASLGPDSPVVIVPWGGHCVKLETFCHYALQVIFLAGVLSGLCLVVAGLVLRPPSTSRWAPPGGPPDLSVLVYIGTLTCAVCSLLLGVQCCVKRPPRRPTRPIPSNLAAPRPIVGHDEMIPLQVIQLDSISARHPNGSTLPEAVSLVNTLTSDPELPYRDESGIPWWRRERHL